MSETAFTPPICVKLDRGLPSGPQGTDLLRTLTAGGYSIVKTDAVNEASAIIKGLVEHIAELINFAETRIQDGKEMGATVWRIALEDIVRASRAALTKAGQ